MELEQESRPLSNNTTVEKDHITWPLSFEKIAEQTVFRAYALAQKSIKLFLTFQSASMTAHFIKWVCRPSSLDPVQTCGHELEDLYWVVRAYLHAW